MEQEAIPEGVTTEVFLPTYRWVSTGQRHASYAGGTHSNRGSFYLTEAGARGAVRHIRSGRVLRGTITWEWIDELGPADGAPIPPLDGSGDPLDPERAP